MIYRLRNLGLKLAAVVACSTPLRAFAQLADPPNDGEITGKEVGDLKTAILTVIKYVLTFMTLIAVVIIIVAGIRYILSQGEEGEKDKAKKAIIYTVIGLVIILLARSIVTFVLASF